MPLFSLMLMPPAAFHFSPIFALFLHYF